jgi:hypothetical protein
MKELILIALMLVASIQCVAIKSEQSHGEHGKGKSGSHLGFFVSSHVMYIKDILIFMNILYLKGFTRQAERKYKSSIIPSADGSKRT